jgi:hypothetical protein
MRWVVVVAVVLCGLGGVVAWQVNGALGISMRPADVPVEHAKAAPATAIAPVPAIGSIAVPDDERLRLAASAVADALVARGAPRPRLGAGPVLTAGVQSGLTGESYRGIARRRSGRQPRAWPGHRPAEALSSALAAHAIHTATNGSRTLLPGPSRKSHSCGSNSRLSVTGV